MERIEVKLKKLILGELKLLSEKPDLDPNLQDTLDRVTNLTWRLMALEGVVVDKPEQVLKEKAMDLIGRVGEMAEEEFGPFSLTAFIAPGDIWLKLDAMFELEQVKLKIKGSLLLELDQTRRRAKDAGESTELLISLGQLRGLVIDMVALERGFRPIGDGEEALLLERAIEIAGTALSQARGFGIQAMVEELGWKLEALRSTAQADRLMKDAASRQLERLLFFAEQRGSSEELIDTIQATWEIVQRPIASETPPGPGLTLEPGRARNLVGQDHVLQVTVTGEGGQPAPAGTVVFYEVLDRNGVVVTSGFTETTGGLPGSGGEAVAFFSYGNDAPAVHQIRAWTDTTTYDEATRRDTAIKVWVALGDLTLTPETANNPVGQEHVVEARVTDGSGAPVPAGLEVFFEVLDQGGNVVASGTSETTGGDGLALFSYSSTAPGTHTIRAWTGGGPAPVLLATGNAPYSVFRYDGQNGAFIDQFVPAGSGGLGLPRDLIYGPDGNLYVNSDAFDKVLRYDGTTGAFIDKFVTDGSGGLSAPYGLVYGPDGNLYVSGFTSNAVHRYDGVSGAFIDLFVPVGSGGLVTPRDLVFGPDGNLYVVAHDSVNVLRYDGGTGAFIDVFASGGGLDSPAGLAFGPDGNLYVSSGGNDVVLRYDGITGAFIDVFIAAGSGGLDSPHGLVFTRDGNLYLASTNTDSVLRYDATTAAFIDEFVASGSGGLNAPHFLVFVAVQTTFDTAIPNLRDQATKEWFEPVSLHGQKWDDLNGNGIWDAGEPGLDGWPIELLDANGQVLAIQTTHSGDFNDDGQIDPVTEQGLYWFNDLRPGDYEVREVPPIFCCNPRWVQTFPGGTAALGEGPAVPETYLVTIDNGQTLENLNFGNHLPPPGSIHGQKWDDLNGDGVWDANEPGLNGWTIELVDSTGQVVATQVTDDMDLNEDGTIDPTEQGWYWFTGLEPGNYDVREESQPGWKQTFPVDTTGQAIDFYFVNLVEGQRVEGKDFGNYRLPTTGEDDQFEDNDTINTATSLAGGEFPDLIALDGDDDWYVVEVCADGNLRVTLQFAHVLGDIDLEVYDAAGNLIDSSTSTGDGEALVLSGLPPGLYFIRVYLFGGEAEGNNYDLLVDPCAQIGGDDQFEENDSLTGAASLLAPAFFPGLIVRIDDEDWFKVEVCPDGTLGVSLSLVHAQGDIDLEIYDAAGNLLAESASTENREEVVLTGLGAGTYFIRVFLFGGDFNGYELAVLVTCGSSIHGQKWNDLNGNGFWDDNEPGLDGFLIELRDPFTGQPVAIPNNPQETHSVDLDDNGVIDPQLEQGWFWFDVEPGDYQVHEVQQPGWVMTFPLPAGFHSFSVGADHKVEGIYFGNRQPPTGGSIHGQKWNDLNGNGEKDAGEPHISGWTIELVDLGTGLPMASQVTHDVDLDQSGTIEPHEQGWYWFEGLPPGEYEVREAPRQAWIQTWPPGFGTYTVLVTENQAVDGVDFGNTQELDFFTNSEGQFTLNTPTGPVDVQLTGPTMVAVGIRPDGGTNNTLVNTAGEFDVVDTEILSMNLTGDVPGIGLVNMRLNPNRPSLGQIVEGNNIIPGILDVPPFNPSGGNADSFFDVFFEIEIDSPTLGLIVLHNEEPKQMVGIITRKPPGVGDTTRVPAPYHCSTPTGTLPPGSTWGRPPTPPILARQRAVASTGRSGTT